MQIKRNKWRAEMKKNKVRINSNKECINAIKMGLTGIKCNKINQLQEVKR